MPARNPITNNIGWKLLSLVLAVLMWLTVETEFQRQEKSDLESQQTPVNDNPTKTFPTVPIILLIPASNTNRFQVSPDTAQVRVGGTDANLRTLTLAGVEAFVDLSDIQDEKEVRKPVQVRVPGNYDVVAIDPTNVNVERITPSR